MLAQRLQHTSIQLFRPVVGTKGSLGARRRVQSQNSSEVDVAAEELSVEIPTRDARSSIRFTVVPTGPASQAIVVEAVADSSSAAEAGIRRGMKLTAISDPVRRNEIWELQDRPSIRYIRDVLRMRSSNYIEMRFVRPTAALMTAMEAADDALQLTASTSGSESDSSSGAGSADTAGSITALTSLSSTDESSSSSSSGLTMAERMQQQFEQKQNASTEVVAFKQRQQRRKDYMEQQGQGSNSTIVLILAASFLLPALVILAVAYGSGYLDALYSNTMNKMR